MCSGCVEAAVVRHRRPSLIPRLPAGDSATGLYGTPSRGEGDKRWPWPRAGGVLIAFPPSFWSGGRSCYPRAARRRDAHGLGFGHGEAGPTDSLEHGRPPFTPLTLPLPARVSRVRPTRASQALAKALPIEGTHPGARGIVARPWGARAMVSPVPPVITSPRSPVPCPPPGVVCG